MVLQTIEVREPPVQGHADNQGRFELPRLTGKVILYARSPAGDFAGYAVVDGAEDSEKTLVARPAVTARGRVVDGIGKPCASVDVSYVVEVDLPADHGFGIPSGAAAAHRVPCSACGLSKRHLFNQAALDGGYDVVATGHNLDDEAAVLFGNVLRWDAGYLGRQLPVLPAGDGFVRKVKPLVRLGEREMAACCILRGIDYIVEECPNAVGNEHLGYKEALNAIEEQSPGSKAAFYFGFLDRASHLFTTAAATERDDLHACPSCGAPTTSQVCAFCKLVERASAPVPVAAPRRRQAS